MARRDTSYDRSSSRPSLGQQLVVRLVASFRHSAPMGFSRRQNAGPKPAAPSAPPSRGMHTNAAPSAPSQASMAPKPSPPPAPASAAAQPPAVQSQGPGLMGTMASSAAGSMVGSAVGNYMFGGGGGSTAAPAPAEQGALPAGGGAPVCSVETQGFLKCMADTGNQFERCDHIYDMMKQCHGARARAQSTVSRTHLGSHATSLACMLPPAPPRRARPLSASVRSADGLTRCARALVLPPGCGPMAGRCWRADARTRGALTSASAFEGPESAQFRLTSEYRCCAVRDRWCPASVPAWLCLAARSPLGAVRLSRASRRPDPCVRWTGFDRSQ